MNIGIKDSHFLFDLVLKVIWYTLIFQNYGQKKEKCIFSKIWHEVRDQ